MAKKKAKTRADFELVFGQGIHPFYLGMELDQVFAAAASWKIVKSVREDSDITIHLGKGGKTIEVSLINTVWLYPGYYGNYRAYYIWTQDARFADGKRLSKMKNKNILSRFTGEHALKRDETYESDSDDEFCGHYDSEQTLLLLIEGLKPSLSIKLRKWDWEKMLAD